MKTLNGIRLGWLGGYKVAAARVVPNRRDMKLRPELSRRLVTREMAKMCEAAFTNLVSVPLDPPIRDLWVKEKPYGTKRREYRGSPVVLKI